MLFDYAHLFGLGLPLPFFPFPSPPFFSFLSPFLLSTFLWFSVFPSWRYNDLPLFVCYLDMPQYLWRVTPGNYTRGKQWLEFDVVTGSKIYSYIFISLYIHLFLSFGSMLCFCLMGVFLTMSLGLLFTVALLCLFAPWWKLSILIFYVVPVSTFLQ